VSGFEDIALEWRGKKYKVKARGPQGRMMAGAKIEQVVTLGELSQHLSRGAVPHVTLCQAYGALLRHVGATATDEEVMDWLGEALEDGDPDGMGQRIGVMIEHIGSILTPGRGQQLKAAGAGGPQENPRKAPSKVSSG